MMGLDIFAGSLSRYYLRAWENEVHPALRHRPAIRANGAAVPFRGLAIEVKTTTPVFDHLNWPDAIQALETWRGSVAAALENPSVHWSESQETPQVTRKITWQAYSALLLWAAYEEQPDLPRPERLPESDAQDTALQRSRADLGDCRYPHLLGETEIWLPGEDNRTFRAPDVCGEKKDIGFIIPLFGELEALNSRTWAADPQTVRGWASQPAEDRDALEDNARFGFAILRQMAATAYRHQLPMVLDY